MNCRPRSFFATALAAAAVCLAHGQVGYNGGVYSQNFDTLPGTTNNTLNVAWADNATLPGWYAGKATFNVTNGTIGGTASTFNSTSTVDNVGLFSFGSAASSDRALGSRAASVGTGNEPVLHGVRLVNTTGQTLTKFTVTYTGEQWFASTQSAAHTLLLDYQFGATALASGIWTAVPTATLTAPISTGTTARSLNGNSSANRTAKVAVVSAISWMPGQELWIRFRDENESGAEQALAVDDFSFIADAESGLFFNGSTSYVTMGFGAATASTLGATNFTLECRVMRTGPGVNVSTGTGGASGVPLIAKGVGEADGDTRDANYFLGIDSNGKLIADFEQRNATNNGTAHAAGKNFPVTGSTTLQQGVFYHVAATYDTVAATWKLYVNGVPETLTQPLPPFVGVIPRSDSIQGLGIGTTINSTGARAGYFQGVIDEARVWGVVRTGAEILANIDQKISSGTGLLARYGFDEAVGTTVAGTNAAGTAAPVGTLSGSALPVWVNAKSFVANLLPTVALTAPANGGSVIFPATIDLAATAGDADGAVVKVEFFNGATKLGEDLTAPYTFSWSSAAVGNHSFTAVATDNLGGTTTSSVVAFSVNPSPNQPPVVTLVAPIANATGIGSSTTLQLSLADPESAAQTVTFYGRKTTPAFPGPDFTIATLPDTQYYSENKNNNGRAATFSAQTQWLLDNRSSGLLPNLAFVSHMGDIAQSGDAIPAEWVVADGAMKLIENPATAFRAHGIPWGVAPGNHDQTVIGSAGGANALYNQYFGTNRYAGRRYWGGSQSPLNNNNNYQLFSASGLDFIIIHLEYDTRALSFYQPVLDWADALLKAHPSRRAIITSHWIVNTGNPATFGPQGQNIYDQLKDNPNLFLMLSGHVHGEGRRSDVFEGRTVYSVLQDYQGRANGGDGWLRYFVFSPANNTIAAKTYRVSNPVNPAPGAFETDSDSEFVLPYALNSAITGWIPLGTVNVSAGGTAAALNWTGLEKSSDYEWYAAVNDGLNTVTTATRRFATATAAAPTVALSAPANGASFVFPAAIELTATAADTDGTIVRVEFYQGGAKLGEDTTAPYTLTWAGLGVGAYAVTATAIDDSGQATVSSVVNLTVVNAANLPPTVALTAPANNATLLAPITLTADAGDADGTVVKVEFFEGTTKLGEDLTAPYSFGWAGAAPGSYVLKAVATDNSGGVTTSSLVNLTVVAPANLPPTVALTAPANNVTLLAPITLTADAGDADGTVVKVEFFEGTTKLGEDLTAPYAFGWAGAAPGSYVLKAVATDNSGGVTTSSLVNLTVVAPANLPPTVALTAPANNATLLAPITLTADAGDADGTVVKVEFFEGTTKLGEDLTAPYSFGWAGAAPGSYVLKAVATDNSGGVTTSSLVNLTVVAPANLPPTVALTAPANNATLLAPITLTADAGDADGTVVKVEFFEGTTKLGEDLTAPYSFGWAGAAPGSYVLKAVATDNSGGVTTSSLVNLTVVAPANLPPTVALTAPANNATLLAPITLTADAGDTDGTVVKVEFFEGTTKLGEDLTAPYSLGWAGAAPGSYVLKAVATDNRGGVTTSSLVNLTVVAPANLPPTVALTAPANNATLLAPITLTADAADTDGTVVKVEFFEGTTKLGEDLTAPYSFGWAGAAPGSYVLKAVATDNSGGVTTSSLVNLTVVAPANLPPTVALTAPANNATLLAPITLTADAGDADGTVVKVEFFEGTTKLGEDLTAPYSFGWAGAAPGSYVLKAVATDNSGGVTTSSLVNLTVVAPANLPPTVALTAPANNATLLAPITLTADAGDADGTVVKVEFFEGTTKLGEDLTAPYSFGWAGAAPGSYVLKAVATDNSGGVTTSSLVNLTVVAPANLPPTVALTAPANNATLLAPITLTADAGDTDGTVVKVEFFEGTTKLGEDLTAPYSLGWAGAAPGSYVLKAVATDNRGGVTTSSLVNLTVVAPANLPPTVALTAPANNATLLAPITLTADAADTDGTVVKVEFFEGTTKLGEDLTAPYAFGWAGASPGSYELKAVATDNSGGVTTSSLVNLTVLLPGGFNGTYAQNFDALGSTGTTPPTGWTVWNGTSGSSNSTWTNATGITGGLASVTRSVGTMLLSSAALTASNAPTANANNGYNAGAPGDSANRMLATAPTSSSGVALQLELTNSTAAPISVVRVAYDIRRFLAVATANELPGYRLFCSVNNGASWTNVTALNPTLAGPTGVIVPNSVGVTNVLATDVTLSAPWAVGTKLLLRWVDDNAVATSPDQIVGLDNVAITLPVGAAPTAAFASLLADSEFSAPAAVSLSAKAGDFERTTPGNFTIIKQGVEDTDADGVPDVYEIAHGMNRTNATDPRLDLDGDGLSNGLEYALGTAANSVASATVPKQGFGIGTDAGKLTLTFNRARAEVVYTVQASSDLTVWTDVAVNPGVVAGNVTVTDNGVVAGLTRFLRLKVQVGPNTFSTVPVGYLKSVIAGGTLAMPVTTVFGVPIADTSPPPAGIGAGRIELFTGTTITHSAGGWTGNLANPAAPWAVRLTSGPSTGGLLDITANTLTTLTVSGADLSAVGLTAGVDTFELVPMDTLGTLFGSDTLLGGTSAASADNVQLHTGTSWLGYYYDTSLGFWRSAVGPATNSDNVIIRPTTGVQIIGRAPSTVLTFTGRAPTSTFRAEISNAGTSVIHAGLPTNTTLGSLAPQALLPGWRSATTAADTVSLFDGSAWVGYFHNGTFWQPVVGTAVNSDATAIPAGALLMIHRPGADAGSTEFARLLPASP